MLTHWYSPFPISKKSEEKLNDSGLVKSFNINLDKNNKYLIIYCLPDYLVSYLIDNKKSLNNLNDFPEKYQEINSLSNDINKCYLSNWEFDKLENKDIKNLINENFTYLKQLNFNITDPEPFIGFITYWFLIENKSLLNSYLDLELKAIGSKRDIDSNYLLRLKNENSQKKLFINSIDKLLNKNLEQIKKINAFKENLNQKDIEYERLLLKLIDIQDKVIELEEILKKSDTIMYDQSIQLSRAKSLINYLTSQNNNNNLSFKKFKKNFLSLPEN